MKSRELEGVRYELRELKRSVEDWQHRHDGQHAGDAEAAVKGRRWMIGTCIAALMLLCTVIGLVLAVLGRTHG